MSPLYLFCSVVTVGFGSDGVTVNESSGQFRMCVVTDRVAVQDIIVTIESQDETAISNLGEYSELCFTMSSECQVMSNITAMTCRLHPI